MKKTKENVEEYIKDQYDIIKDSISYVENAKVQYEDATKHIQDIEIIENAEETLKEKIIHTAEQINELSTDRRILKSSRNKISNNTFRMIERNEDKIYEDIKSMNENENYHFSVSNDMRMLEGEQFGLRLESQKLVTRQKKIRKMSLFFLVCLAIVNIVFLISFLIIESNQNMFLFIVVTALSALFALSMLSILKLTQRQVLITQIKMDKAAVLLNKIKIKYVNISNVLDYQYNKYKIKNVYELQKKYEAYLQIKDEQTKAVMLTSHLNDAQIRLEKLLKQLSLYDTHIWMSQTRALTNPKEMVEIRHALNVSRQKLRDQMEYNDSKIQEAKDNIKNITNISPKYAQYVIDILDGLC